MEVDLRVGNSLEVLKELPDNSVDSIVTDPPYGINFMGKKWDYDVPSVELWKECFRVLKHGGYLLSFAGTRTQHRMAVNIEDAGFEIRDMIAWIYGSGFPKSLDISKAIDKSNNELIDESKTWEGWGTALKPALEPITLARKPLIEKTVANNVLKHGVGGLNIDGCRVEIDEVLDKSQLRTINRSKKSDNSGWGMNKNESDNPQVINPKGRFPANLIHDGSDEVEDIFPYTKSGAMKKSYNYVNNGFSLGKPTGGTKQIHDSNEGSASRFFYCAKTSVKDREEGLVGFEEKLQANANFRPNHLEDAKNGESGKPHGRYNPRANNHPTVKPTELMRYLVRLITPKNGIVLDPFNGSGSTGKACAYEFVSKYIGIDLDSEYIELSKARINFAINDNKKDNQITLDLK